MVKRFLLSIIIFVLVFQLTSSAKALEGLIKFPDKKDATVFLEIAQTEEEKSKGLMNRPTLAKNRGMVFIFRPHASVTFWMKDTLIPLDMIFIEDGKIVKIVKNALPNQTDILYPSDYEVSEVVEVNGGFTDMHMIKAGETVLFENISQIGYSGKSKLMIVAR